MVQTLALPRIFFVSLDPLKEQQVLAAVFLILRRTPLSSILQSFLKLEQEALASSKVSPLDSLCVHVIHSESLSASGRQQSFLLHIK